MNAQTRRCEWCCEIVTGQEKCGCEPETEIDRLRGFARDVMSAWPDGGIDGGELQDIAVKHSRNQNRSVRRKLRLRLLRVPD
jgi:hypothetical protein